MLIEEIKKLGACKELIKKIKKFNMNESDMLEYCATCVNGECRFIIKLLEKWGEEE